MNLKDLIGIPTTKDLLNYFQVNNKENLLKKLKFLWFKTRRS
jgi:hypothetical protein